MAKAIVAFSDGTGNSSAALFKTNVWRLYEALDQGEPKAGQRRQIAYYDNGVGTSTFKPLAILGGAFGVGLKRNILDLYKFICRNYEDGDDIYVFGFSRGAFTVRLLVGLIVTQGLVSAGRQELLDRHALDAYRAYRRRFDQTGGAVNIFRGLRDAAVGMARRLTGTPHYDADKMIHTRVKFVGVWDTVAAYGMPIAELTRGIDRWVWPLSMPNYKLSEKVDAARHALALDDERDTFRPLVWDELHERELVANGAVPEGRLQQVWFAGMHSDVGGGYPDDSLSYVSAAWMLQEAQNAQLRFKLANCRHIRAAANACGPMHDSRRGIGGYYRYQPRKITALLEMPDCTTKIMQDPDLNGQGLLTSVVVHESVLERIQKGTHTYAPIVLPAEFKVLGRNGPVPPPTHSHNGDARASCQEAVWNDVWKRRVNYFASLAVSLAIAFMPTYVDESACIGPQCLLSPAIAAAGAVLPGFLESWIEAFSRNPGTFLLLVVALALLFANAGRLQRRIDDSMAAIWRQALSAQAMSATAPANWIYKFRTSAVYQNAFAMLKWKVLPDAAGVSMLLIVLCLPLVFLSSLYLRTDMALAERYGGDCETGVSQVADQRPAEAAGFDTTRVCWATGIAVTEGHDYRISFIIREPWGDAHIVADPRGFGSERMGLIGDIAALTLRRSLADPWFRPLLKIVPTSQAGSNRAPRYVHALKVAENGSFGRNRYYAEFKAGATGEVVLFVNDALQPLDPKHERYTNNSGVADVCIERIVRDGNVPRPQRCFAGM